MGKKNKKGKKKRKALETPQYTEDNPLVLDGEPGVVMFELRKAVLSAAAVCSIFAIVNDHNVKANVGEKRTTWYLNNKGIPAATLNNIICNTELDEEMYEKYGTKQGKKIKEKAKKDKSNDELPDKKILVTGKQLKTKYTKDSIVDHLEFVMFGKKKKRKAAIESITKKKMKGSAIVKFMNDFFGATEADIFHLFERIKKA